MSLGEYLENEDPESRWARLDVNSKSHFLVNYSQAAGAASHEWVIQELYFNTLLGPNPDGPVLTTNCNQLIGAVVSSDTFHGLLVNIGHIVEQRRRARIAAGEKSGYIGHICKVE